MFYHYEIKNNGVEDILYLYLSMKYEIASEISFENDEDLGRRTNNFIQTNKINFKGKKVYLVVDGMIVKSLDISKTKTNNYKNQAFSCDDFVVNIVLEDHSICEILLKDYLLSILFSFYNPFIHDEVYKAICVMFNTYAYKMMKENNFILGNDSFFSYKPINDYKDTIIGFDEILNRFKSIIYEVDCLFLKYKDEYILPFIHYSNSGKTVSNPKYPYLSSVKCLWDITSPNYISINDYSFYEINSILGTQIDDNSIIDIRNNNGNNIIIINDNIFNIEEIRKKLNLCSNTIYLIVYKHFIRFISLGAGNGYGMSIFGACEIAKNGGKYFNILKYFFPKVNIYKYVENK